MFTNFQRKRRTLNFWAVICPTNGLGVQIIQNLTLDSESATLRYHGHQFEHKSNNFPFLCPNLPKKLILGSELQKSKSGFGFTNLEIVSAPIFRQNQQLQIFWPKFAQKWILGLKYQKSKAIFGISILEILCAPIFSKNGQVGVFGPKFAQKWILGLQFPKSKSRFRISNLQILGAPIFRQREQL